MNDNQKERPTVDAPETVAKTGGTCPLCGKPALLATRPFCSKRCADVDLSRWLNGVYAVPGKPSDEDEDGEA